MRIIKNVATIVYFVSCLMSCLTMFLSEYFGWENTINILYFFMVLFIAGALASCLASILEEY